MAFQKGFRRRHHGHHQIDVVDGLCLPLRAVRHPATPTAVFSLFLLLFLLPFLAVVAMDRKWYVRETLESFPSQTRCQTRLCVLNKRRRNTKGARGVVSDFSFCMCMGVSCVMVVCALGLPLEPNRSCDVIAPSTTAFASFPGPTTKQAREEGGENGTRTKGARVNCAPCQTHKKHTNRREQVGKFI